MPQNIETQFEELYSGFERKETDLNKLQDKEGFSKFLLVRSLDKEHLKELINEHTEREPTSSGDAQLYKDLYCSDVSEQDLIEYIQKEYPTVKQKREEQEEFLPNIIDGFGEVRCGVRNDNLNDVAKALVRDKSIQSRQQLEERIDSLLGTTIKGYLEWQYYNQVTNDLIEHYFNNHPNVIPTLRKIKYVDFMVKIGDKIVPFDLKITHIADDFFDMKSKGLIEKEDGKDSFILNTENGRSEKEIIKAFYDEVKTSLLFSNLSKYQKGDIKEFLQGFSCKHPMTNVKDAIKAFLDQEKYTIKDFKDFCNKQNEVILIESDRKYELPKVSSSSKPDIIEVLSDLDIDFINEKLDGFRRDREALIGSIRDDLTSVEWWNYRYQGERLFKNNNRFYIFLSYENSFDDARPLKGDLDAIKDKVTAKLDEICQAEPHNIRYYYEKDPGLKGEYKIQSTSILHTR